MIEETSADRARYPRDSPAAAPHARGHDEWLIDESLAETFPASDAPSPVRPGSTVSSHYSADEPYARAARDIAEALRLPVFPFAWAAIGLSLLCLVVLLKRRDR
jgi:hypothetical protein